MTLQAIVTEETHAAPHLSHVRLDKETVTVTLNAFLVHFETYLTIQMGKCDIHLHFKSGLLCGSANCVGPTFDSTDDCCEAPPGEIIVVGG